MGWEESFTGGNGTEGGRELGEPEMGTLEKARRGVCRL